jgi:hypothetical protein
MMLCLSVYKALWAAEKNFKDVYKESYPGMDKVEAFKKANIKFSIKFNNGQVEVGKFGGITPEIETAAKDEAKKAEDEKGKADEGKDKKETPADGAKAPGTVDYKKMADALRTSKMGQSLQMFLGQPVLNPDGTQKLDPVTKEPMDGYMDAVRGGGGWAGWLAMIAADMEGVDGIKGKTVWGGFLSACKAIGGGIGGTMLAGADKAEKWIKDWVAGDTGTAEAAETKPEDARKLTKGEFIGLASKPGGLKVEEKDITVTDAISYKDLLAGNPKCDYVEVKFQSEEKQGLQGVDASKVSKVDNGVEKPMATTATTENMDLAAGTYRIRCDIPKLYVRKGNTVLLHKASDVPAKPTGTTA